MICWTQQTPIMAYYPQYGSSPAAYPQYGLRHSTTTNDATIAAALQAEMDTEIQASPTPADTLRDSAMARALQAEEKLKARGTFKVVCRQDAWIFYRSSTNFDDKLMNLPGVRNGDTLEGTAMEGSDGLAYVRVSAAGLDISPSAPPLRLACQHDYGRAYSHWVLLHTHMGATACSHGCYCSSQ